MVFNDVPRAETLFNGMRSLLPLEKYELREALNSRRHGGSPLVEPLRTRAVKLGLAFKSTGRLRPDTCKLLEYERHMV